MNKNESWNHATLDPFNLGLNKRESYVLYRYYYANSKSSGQTFKILI